MWVGLCVSVTLVFARYRGFAMEVWRVLGLCRLGLGRVCVGVFVVGYGVVKGVIRPPRSAGVLACFLGWEVRFSLTR